MRWYLLPVLVLLLIACDVPSASKEKNPTLVIASDNLTAKDSLFFAEFQKEKKVTIELKQMSTDSLIQLFKKDPYGLGIDIVLIHHLYDMRRIRNTQMLEPLRGTFPEEAQIPENREFIKIGIDPFICASKPNIAINVYEDLNNTPHFMQLQHKSKAHFFAPYEERLHRSKTFERMSNLKESEVPMKAWYIDSSQAILTTYSTYKNRAPEDSIWNVFSKLQYPNSATSGVFHDVLSAGVVRQSSNYLLSIELLEWMTKFQTNKKLVRNRGYAPLRSNGEYRRFATSPIVLMQYHTMIERMLKELQ
ncbi:MAG: hypothetical protein Crog4KO_09110 [Crocinitomicaceae bacterium]